MEYRTLGRSGVTVSTTCLGAMMFGSWGNPSHDEAVRIVHQALDAGINIIDTADVHSAGESEQIVGKALADGRCDDVVLATKFHCRPTGSTCTRYTAPAQTPTSRRPSARSTTWCTRARCVTSVPPPSPPARLCEAQWVARERHLQRFIAEQPSCSILTGALRTTSCPSPPATTWEC